MTLTNDNSKTTVETKREQLNHTRSWRPLTAYAICLHVHTMPRFASAYSFSSIPPHTSSHCKWKLVKTGTEDQTRDVSDLFRPLRSCLSSNDHCFKMPCQALKGSLSSPRSSHRLQVTRSNFPNNLLAKLLVTIERSSRLHISINVLLNPKH